VTEVAFHFNAPDRLGYACRLLRKAYFKGARLQVLADPSLAAALDQQLWLMAGVEFVPHCRSDAPASMQVHSPIMIGSQVTRPLGDGHVLVNLSDTLPDGFQHFDRVIEVVTADPSVRALARERWKQYKAAGHDPLHLDLSAAGPARA
jgi:DNA polymerase III subunit chi